MGILLMACQYHVKKQEFPLASPSGNTVQTMNTIPDMDIPDFDRTPVSLIGEIKKNHITIIDFWASWCGPCMREMPLMKELYTAYSKKGLGIVGISLDTDYAAWKNTVNSTGLGWKQLSELRGWDSFAVKKCNISSIPHTVVVNEKGQIMAENLHGNDLIEFISRQLDINKTTNYNKRP